MTPTTQPIPLTGLRLTAFGAQVTVEAAGDDADELLSAAADRIRKVSDGLSRFDPASELSRVNADPRDTVEADPLMIDFVESAIAARDLTGGLVDPTLLPEIERAGYVESKTPNGVKPVVADSSMRSVRVRLGPDLPPRERTRTLSVDRARGTVTRKPGVRFDAGGIGKGLAADLVAELMETAMVAAWSVDCLGDVRVGGTAGASRSIEIASPVEGAPPVGVMEVSEAGIATSGTTRRNWSNPDGTAAHHLIDPRTGLPAKSDLIQVSAVAPTAVEAEARAKAALLSGLDEAATWLTHGGLMVDRDGGIHRLDLVDQVA